MKQTLLLLTLVILTTSGFAQVDLRQKASKYLQEGKLDSALAVINVCIKHPATIKDAKTWFVRGNIYLEISVPENSRYKMLENNPVQQALYSYKKATEYDTRKEYAEDIYAKVNWQRNNYFNQGVDFYNQKQYKEAMNAFEDGANALASINNADTIALFYAAACAGLANETPKQKELYLRLLNNHAKSPAIYTSLADIYRLENDSANGLKVIRAGMKLYPDDLQLFLTETNIYLTFGNTAKALRNLKLATEKDPGNATVFFALGTIYDNMANDNAKNINDREKYFNLAVNTYKTTIELNPDFYEPNYNLGAIFVNKAAEINDKAQKVPLDADEEFNRLKAEADIYLEAAIPYLEKASQIRPEDSNTLSSLQQIYTRLKKDDELQSVNNRISALHK